MTPAARDARTSTLFRLAAALLLIAAGAPGADAQERSDEERIAGAVIALPPGLRSGAEVRASDGETVLRAGENGLICLADAPGDGRFGVSCYHESLEPFMARGRQLRARGLEGMEYQETRWKEVEEGRLEMPSGPAMVYNLGFPTEDVDPATADWRDGGRLHAVYIPFATPESTGIPTSPEGGGPWLMWPGQAGAHIMIGLPPRGGDGG